MGEELGMNPDLEKCRQHYTHLSPHIKERATAQFLFKAIEIAEKLDSQLINCVAALRAVESRKTVGDEMDARKLVSAALADVTKSS